MKVRRGDHVEKRSGYKFPGVVIMTGHTLSGEYRLVVECTVPECAGALHIFNEDQLRVLVTRLKTVEAEEKDS